MIASLEKKPANGGKAALAKPRDQHRRVGDRHVLPQPAHLAHVLLVVQADDHRPRSEEQRRLEESMSEQVEHRRRVGRSAERHGHIAELRERGVGYDALDVVDDDRDERHEQRRDAADDDDERARRVRELEERRHACHHEDAGRHHRRRMDQRGDRRRTLHRIGQPDVQRDLRGLAHGSDEEQHADQREQRPGHVRDDVDR